MALQLQLHITRRAAREIERIVQWWGANRPAAPGAVRKELHNVTELLLQQPGIGAVVDEASSPDVRRFHVERIRYWLYYRVRGEPPRSLVGLAFEPRRRPGRVAP